MAEDQVLVELDGALAVQVDVEQLPGPERLGDAGREVEPGHLLVADLGVEADHVAVVELGDEREGVPDGGQQDVAAGLVRLRLDGEPHLVALLDDVAREQVDRLAVAVEGRADVLGAVVLRTLAAAPEDVGAGAQLGGEVEVADHLAQREPPDRAVVAGEPAVLEHRVREQVRGHHRHRHAGLRQRVLEPGDVLVAVGVPGAERDQVVVVEGDARGAACGELVHRHDRVERRAGGVAERVAALPADGPEPEREAVLPGGRGDGARCHGRTSCYLFSAETYWGRQ